jgi:hypothetical protein
MPLRRFLYGILVAAAFLWIAGAAAVMSAELLSNGRTIWAEWHTDMSLQDCLEAGGAMAVADCEYSNRLLEEAGQHYALAISAARSSAVILFLPAGGLLLMALLLRWPGAGRRRGTDAAGGTRTPKP